jgi:hypothetical protein
LSALIIAAGLFIIFCFIISIMSSILPCGITAARPQLITLTTASVTSRNTPRFFRSLTIAYSFLIVLVDLQQIAPLFLVLDKVIECELSENLQRRLYWNDDTCKIPGITRTN